MKIPFLNKDTAATASAPGFLGTPKLGRSLLRALAEFTVKGHQTVSSFCSLATADGDALVSFSGAYMTLLRVEGSSIMMSPADTEEKASQLRNRLAASLEHRGHAMQFHFVSDPASATDAIERCVTQARAIATRLGADFDDVFAEWLRVFPKYMRYEGTWVALWSKTGLLNKQERKASLRAKSELDAALPRIEDGQDITLADADLASRHAAFVQQVRQAFLDVKVQTTTLTAAQALKTIRTIIYPETRDDLWQPSLPPAAPPQMVPDVETPSDIDHMVWPPVREQLFTSEAESDGFTIARFGGLDWAPLDMSVAPDVTAEQDGAVVFADLVRALSTREVPWRATMLVEGVDQSYGAMKGEALRFFNFWPNKHRYQAFQQLADIRQFKTDTLVRLRGNFATSAPMGDRSLLQLRTSRLQQGLTAWAGCQASRWCGDPVAGVLSSVPGLDTASTAPAHVAPLRDVLSLMPWARPGLPWQTGSILFRSPDGAAKPLDPGASGRPATLDLFVAPSRSGKSVAANRLLFGTVLSAASATNDGYKLPLIAKLDIAESVSGLIDMIRAALPVDQRHLAAYYRFELTPDKAYNPLEIEPGCRRPTLSQRTFLTNFLGLVCLNAEGRAYDRMDHLILAIVDVVYDIVSDAPGASYAKKYAPRVEAAVDRAIERLGVEVDRNTRWIDIVDALCAAGEWRLAGLANRHAAPVMLDLITAARDPRIYDRFSMNRPTMGEETLVDVFQECIQHFITQYPTIGIPSKLDLGDARIVALDIERVCPRDRTKEALRQTELMFLLGFFIISRKLTTDPADADDMPLLVRDYHRARYLEYRETYKRLEADEYHRTGTSEYVRTMIEFVARESAKYRLSLGISSQAPEDFGDFLVKNSTGRFIFGSANHAQADEMARLFGLCDASRDIVKYHLNGPAIDGSGAPFLLQIKVNNIWYEQMLVNLLGPIELWALSTNPVDRGLRSRLYDALGPAEARRRLARVFPTGTAVAEIDRRKSATGNGDMDGEGVDIGAVDSLARELVECTGLAAILRAGLG